MSDAIKLSIRILSYVLFVAILMPFLLILLPLLIFNLIGEWAFGPYSFWEIIDGKLKEFE